MKSSIVLVTAVFLCLVAFPTTTVGKSLRFWPKPIDGWPNPSEISRNEIFMSSSHKFNYGDSKVWTCTYSNGSAPAISISPSIPSIPTPSHPTPKTSPPPPTPSPPPPTPSPPPPTPKRSPSLPPPPTPKRSPSLPPPPTPKKSPSLPPPPTPNKSPSLPPPTPKKSPTPSPPSDDESSSPSQPANPPPEHHQTQWEHINSCMINMGPAAMCRAQMDVSYYTNMFQVSEYCCNLIVNMKNECDDAVLGFFTDPFFVPLVRCTCHVTY